MNLIGKMLANRYEILEKIGNGGMAVVYKAKCHVLNRFVAVKVLKDEFITDNEFIKRFRTEAQAAASLTHPNIVSIYDVGNEGDIYYIVMELIQGKTLKEIIVEDGKFSWKWSVNIAIQIASALETAHRHNIVHRDIKPHNIIITEDGMAKVTDFGIAKAVSNSTITAFGTTIGSVHYFSPEHAKGGYTDAKSDLYSLGVVMYEMLTGRVPFDADTPVSVALMQVQDDPIEPRKLNPQIPISVNNIILKAMQKNPNDRYASATDMLIDLSTALKRPDDDFVTLPNKQNDLQTQRLSTLYDIDEKAKQNDEEDDIEEPPRKRNKKEGNKVIAFFKRHVILSVILAGILIFSLALGGTILFMNLSKDEEALIPNLVTNENGDRLTLEEAQAIYDETAFEKELKVEYEISEEVEPGYVIRQDPEYSTVNNMRMKLSTEFTIYVSEEREKIETPSNEDIVGKELEEVQKKLTDLGFTNVIVEGETHESLKEGLVIRLSEEGKELYADDELIIYVSTGDGKIDVPDVLGKSESDAKKELEDAGFKVKVSYDEDSDEEDGVVLKQSSKKAKEGATITITVNKKPQEVEGTVIVNVKNRTGGYESNIDEEGNPVDTDVFIDIIVTDSDGNSKTYSNRADKNNDNYQQKFTAKGEVAIEVYIDDQKEFEGRLDLSKETTLTVN